MNCSTVDLKAYLLGEADRTEKGSVEDHLRACHACQEELDRLKLTESALRSIEDEEVPQRIAFVSDKVFEPRWYQTIWRSGPVMGFASAVLVAGAILVHAYARPAVVATPAVDTARIEHEVNARIDAAVAQALKASQTKQAEQTAALLESVEKRFQAQRKEDLAMAREAARYYQMEISRATVALNRQMEGQ